MLQRMRSVIGFVRQFPLQHRIACRVVAVLRKTEKKTERKKKNNQKKKSNKNNKYKKRKTKSRNRKERDPGRAQRLVRQSWRKHRRTIWMRRRRKMRC